MQQITGSLVKFIDFPINATAAAADIFDYVESFLLAHYDK